MSSASQSTPGLSAKQRRIPEFFLVGHAKSGTTAMYEMLRRHPQIYMPDFDGLRGKEPWYFARDNPNPQTSGERSITFTGRHEMSFEEYLALFAAARPEQITGEASTSYLWSRVAASRIAEVRPDARIIAILREPASFLRSLHLQLLQNHSESEIDFRKAVELDQPRRENKHIPHRSYWPAALIYSDRVRYVEQLSRFEEIFGRERMLVLIYDDFRAENEATVRRVLRFLGVDDQHPIEPLEANPTIGVRSVRFEELKRGLTAGEGRAARTARAALKGLTSPRVRKQLLYPLEQRLRYRDPPPPDEQFVRELRRRFAGEVRELGEYLERDLVSLWGYDEVS